jgi:hypothetical protein
MTSKHGEVASVIATSHRVKTMIPALTDVDGQALPANEKLFRQKQIEFAAKKDYENVETERKLAADLFNLLSVESKTLVREARIEAWDDNEKEILDNDGQTVYENWHEVMNRDALSIMRRVDKTHMTANTGSDLNDRWLLMTTFMSMRMTKDESLGSFLDRFNSHIRIMRANDVHVETEANLAGLFIMKLNDSYSEFKSASDNDYRKDRSLYPKTILEAYNFAQYFHPAFDASTRTFKETERGVSRTISPASAYHAAARHSEINADILYANKYGGPRSEEFNGRESKDTTATRGTKRVMEKCDYCEEYHWHRECPRLRRILKEAKDSSSMPAGARIEQPKRKVAFVTTNSNSDSQDLEASDSVDLEDHDQPEY